MTYKDIPAFRFEGYSNQQLSDLANKLNSGDGARAFGKASYALRTLAAELERTDEVLRKQLGNLGVDWQGMAGDQAKEGMNTTVAYNEQASQDGQQNSQATMSQSEANSRARNGMPDQGKLNGPTSTDIIDDTAGFFGIETSNAKKVEQTNAARQQAIDNMNGYVSSSQAALDGFRAPGQPPNFEVTTASSASTPVAHVQQPSFGTPGVHGTPGTAGLPGSTPGLQGNPVNPTPNLPGGTTGTLPGTPNPGQLPVGPGLPGKAGSPLPVGLGIATAATAGLSAAAATAKGGKVVGGGRGPSQAPKTPIAPGGPKGAPSTIGAEKAGATKGGAAGVAAEEHGPNRPAARGGAAGGKSGSGLMSPAAGAAKGEGEEDGEHVRKYGVDSDDVFGDERMVVQSVIGEDPKDQ